VTSDDALGAVPVPDGTRFALWSPRAKSAAVRLFADGNRALRTEELVRGEDGVFAATLAGVSAGALYKFVLDGVELPDPYARFLPFGVHGPARVEPRSGDVRIPDPPPLERLTIYELHVGTFTPEGTWAAARGKLDALVDLGVSAIEVMPIAAFAGTRGWGYDGVALFAPFAPYGEPEDVRAFVRACHERSLAVFLDVVYNHFGPAGNYLAAYAPAYFTSRHKTPWGDAPDFSEPRLRRLVLANARYWLGEFGFDGLRLDATDAIKDDSPTSILAALGAVAADLSPPRLVIAEDEQNDPALVSTHRLDAIWADDFHHVVHALMTSERDGYYAAFAPTVEELARTIAQGWRYEGETYALWNRPRGAPGPQLAARNFVYAVQNHDQIGNRPLGTRLHHVAGLDAHLAAATLLLFLPMTPLLFMGEEWAASTPFLYFTDHEEALGRAVTAGRSEAFAHFEGFADPKRRLDIPDPQARSTFERSRLAWEERTREPHARALALYKRMLALRASDPVLSTSSRACLACEPYGSCLIVRRWLGAEERTLLFNPFPVPAALPRPLERDDVLAASANLVSAAELPAHSALILRGRVGSGAASEKTQVDATTSVAT
jgi:maltooligosyltrehalose trehalohydrolase